MPNRVVLSIVEVLFALMAFLMSGRLASITMEYFCPKIGSAPFRIVFHRSLWIPVLLLALYLIRRGFGGWSLEDFGLKRGEGFRAGLRDGLIAFSVSSLAFLPFLVLLMPFHAEQLSIYGKALNDMSILKSVSTLLALSPVVLIDSPIHEELFFRGYYSGMLSEKFNPLVGVLGSTLFFGLQHALVHPDWHPGMVAATVPLGLIFALTYNRNRSLISVITAHFLSNFLLIYPAVFYATGHISIAISACLTIALASVTILLLHKYRTRHLLINGLKTLGPLDRKSLSLTALFTALSLSFNYVAIMFRSIL